MQDSPIIQCFRSVWQRLMDDCPAPNDLAQIEHMAHWLEEKLAGYEQPMAFAEQLGVIYEAAAQGWGQILEGCYLLADFLASGELEYLERAQQVSEEGELTLQQLEAAILESRPQESLCDGYLD